MSRSSWPLSMPMFRSQLKSTALRSLASFAGVYGSATPPRGPGAVIANGPLSARPAASAALIQLILRKSMVVIPLVRKLGRAYCGWRMPVKQWYPPAMIHRITPVRALVITTASLLCGLLFAATSSAPVTASDKTGPVVRTAEGPVSGLVRNGVYEFLGIPYAAPPVGKWRWMPPQPVTKWKEPRDATRFGSICAQSTTLG